MNDNVDKGHNEAQPTRSIIFTGIATFAVLFMLFAYGIGLFAFFFPRPMVSFMQNIGNHRSAAMFAHRTYVSNPTQANRLSALDSFITINNHARIIQLAPDAFDYEGRNYVDIRIHGAYVMARMHRGEYEQAIDFVQENFESLNISLLRPCFLYFLVIDFPGQSIPQSTLDSFQENFLEYFGEIYERVYEEVQEWQELTPLQQSLVTYFIDLVESYKESLD